jgi:hypothetical protein
MAKASNQTITFFKEDLFLKLALFIEPQINADLKKNGMNNIQNIQK